MYDAIVVGARVGGSATAMLLARRGMKVLVVDRASFPSDTLSTHQIQVPGVALLLRWGLLDAVVGSGAPPARRVRFQQEDLVIEGSFPEFEGASAVYSPRRTVLDGILLDAARSAGAEVRERFIVEELVMEAGRVAGIRGARKGSDATLTERARIVIGADGKHSLVARSVGAPAYRERPVQTAGFYTYFEGVPLAGGELYSGGRRAVGAWPTNDGLTLTFAAVPIAEFDAVRRNPEEALMASLDGAGDLGERVRDGRRVERVRATSDLPNRFRQAHGPGWVLVGDAGLVMDPVTGQGIGHAFGDAELVARAVEDGLGGRVSLETSLAVYQRRRDAARSPMYEMTADVASFSRPKEMVEVLFAALAEDPGQTTRFLGVITGAVAEREFFAPRNLVRLVGVRGIARLMRGRMRQVRTARKPPPGRRTARVPIATPGGRPA
ncbi:MAG TPA: NAD(P)/FAD-dependent oxidoreductase [Actinomycetota bacterium]|nr:NAD(P)/FAD-dependent oxidoreductase [Actinomycetota bacterium]